MSRDDDVAAVEEALVVLGRACAARDVRPDLGVEQHLVLRGVQRGDGDGQRVVLHRHELGGVGACGPVRAQDHRDDVADEANDVLRDDRPSHALLEHRDRRRPRRDVDVGAREDLHARKRLCRGCVDSGDAGMREERADKRDREGAFERQVLDVRGFAAEEARIFLSEHAVPEDAQPGLPSRERASCALVVSWARSKICSIGRLRSSSESTSTPQGPL